MMRTFYKLLLPILKDYMDHAPALCTSTWRMAPWLTVYWARYVRLERRSVVMGMGHTKGTICSVRVSPLPPHTALPLTTRFSGLVQYVHSFPWHQAQDSVHVESVHCSLGTRCMKCTHTSHYSIVDSSTLTLNVTNSFNLHLEEAVQLKHFPVYHGHTSVFCVLCPHLLPPSPLQKDVPSSMEPKG